MNDVYVKLLDGTLLTISSDDVTNIRHTVANELDCPPSCVTIARDPETGMYAAMRESFDLCIRINQDTQPRTQDIFVGLTCYSVSIDPYGEYLWFVYDPRRKQFGMAYSDLEDMGDDPGDPIQWAPTLREAFWHAKDTGLFRYPSALTEYADSMDHRFAMLHLMYEMRGHYYTASLYRWHQGYVEYGVTRPALPPVFFCDTLHESANDWFHRT